MPGKSSVKHCLVSHTAQLLPQRQFKNKKVGPPYHQFLVTKSARSRYTELPDVRSGDRTVFLRRVTCSLKIAHFQNVHLEGDGRCFLRIM